MEAELRAFTFVAAWATLISLITNASNAAPTMTDEQLRTIIAASPVRELVRTWTKCIDDIQAIALLNRIEDAARIEAFAYTSCEEWESRLTGEIVKRHGLSKADAAIDTLKSRLKPTFEETARQISRRPADYYGQVGMWVIYKDSSSRCSA